jgi:AsmA protein
MSVQKKRILIIAGAITVLLVIAAVAIIALVDINSYKAKIESAASEATGMEVLIKGRMGISLFPFGASAGDVIVRSKEGEVISVEKLHIGVELMPLLKKEIRVKECELVRPAVTIVKDAAGRYNFEGAEKKPAPKRARIAFSINEIKLSHGALVYIDKKTANRTELKDLKATINDLWTGGTGEDILTNISFAGKIDCGEVRRKNLIIENVRAETKAGKGIFSITPLTMDIFGGKAEGGITMDMSAHTDSYKVNLKLTKFSFEKFYAVLEKKMTIGGEGTITTSLTAHGKDSRQIMQSLNGKFSLRGDDLSIYTMDLDKFIAKFEETQKFTLIDIGAFFLAGPIGIAATKGYNYGNFYLQTWGGTGTIKKLISEWEINNGTADAADCALATEHNRIAIRGKLDLVNDKYDNMFVAVLDDKGCARFEQKISGPFSSPRIGAVSAFQSIGGPVLNLWSKAKSLMDGGKCEEFYRGSVQHPK